MQRAIVVDRERCVGCYACVVACRLEHHLSPYPAYPPVATPKGPALIRIYQIGPRITGDRVQQYFQPILCRHSPDAPCIRACPTVAIYKDAQTGITLVEEGECIGCRSCLGACPYAAPQFYDGMLMLCDLCLGRLREAGQTACEAACPAGAIQASAAPETSVLASG